VHGLTSPASVGSEDFFRCAFAVSEEFGLSPVAAAEHYLNCYGDGARRDPIPTEVREQLRANWRTHAQGSVWRASASDDPHTYGDTRRGVRFRALVRECVALALIDAEDAARLLGVVKLDMDALPSLDALNGFGTNRARPTVPA
jgi:hypothetical protein